MRLTKASSALPLTAWLLSRSSGAPVRVRMKIIDQRMPGPMSQPIGLPPSKYVTFATPPALSTSIGCWVHKIARERLTVSRTAGLCKGGLAVEPKHRNGGLVDVLAGEEVFDRFGMHADLMTKESASDSTPDCAVRSVSVGAFLQARLQQNRPNRGGIRSPFRRRPISAPHRHRQATRCSSSAQWHLPLSALTSLFDPRAGPVTPPPHVGESRGQSHSQ
jgi:hypothetical protein